MNEMTLQVGVVGIFALLVIDKLLSIIKYKKGVDNHWCLKKDDWDKIIARVGEIYHQSNDLHKWHSKEDSDGIKIWYVRRQLEVILEKLAKNVEEQTKVMTLMIQRLETIERKIDKRSRHGTAAGNTD